jgi:hypothetical protein
VPRSRLLWLQVADRQYHDLPQGLRASVDRRLAQLVENPTSDRDADYNERLDQWSVPLGDDGFVVAALAWLLITAVVVRLAYRID